MWSSEKNAVKIGIKGKLTKLVLVHFCWLQTVSYNNVVEASAKFHRNHRKLEWEGIKIAFNFSYSPPQWRDFQSLQIAGHPPRPVFHSFIQQTLTDPLL